MCDARNDGMNELNEWMNEWTKRMKDLMNARELLMWLRLGLGPDAGHGWGLEVSRWMAAKDSSALEFSELIFIFIHSFQPLCLSFRWNEERTRTPFANLSSNGISPENKTVLFSLLCIRVGNWNGIDKTGLLVLTGEGQLLASSRFVVGGLEGSINMEITSDIIRERYLLRDSGIAISAATWIGSLIN